MDKSFRYILFRNLLFIFIPALVFLFILSSYYLSVSKSADLRVIKASEYYTIEKNASVITEDIRFIVKSMLVLSETPMVINVLEGNVLTYTGHVKNYFIDFANRFKIFDQIRIIDSSGFEVIRVDYNNGLANFIDDQLLQNKKNRYYFKDTYKLLKGEVFISPLDLNIENGEIEIPLKPMLRIATPVYRNDSTKLGILIFNMLGDYVINTLFDIKNESVDGNLMLLNKNGYFLKGVSAVNEFAFMFPEKEDSTFGKLFPEEWEIMKNSANGQFFGKNGLYTYKNIYPVYDSIVSSSGTYMAKGSSINYFRGNDYYWKLVSKVENEQMFQAHHERSVVVYIIISVLSVLLFIVSYIVAKANALRKQSINSIIESKDKLAKLNKSKDAFFSIVSHDLRSPLASAKGFSDLISEFSENNQTEEVIKLLPIVNLSISRALTFLDNLLDWSRSQKGSIKYEPTNFKLKAEIDNAVEILKESSIQKGIKIINNIDNNKVVYTDKNILETIVRILVSNAIKFTNEGGEIIINSESDKMITMDNISISDTGVGIPDEKINGIFDLGHDSERGTSNEPGIGLGLVIVKELVDLINGEISVTSTLGKGTTFKIQIPEPQVKN